MAGPSIKITPGIVKPEMTQFEQPQIPLEDNQNVYPNKRNSVYSLTLDEYKDKSGKKFGAMNMDDLLNDLWNAENNSNNNPNLETVPTTLCNKTLEEVWDEIATNGSSQNSHNVNVNENGKGLHKGQETIGEMTLEDFLVKVGVIQDGSVLFPRPKPIESYQNSDQSLINNDAMCLSPNFNGQVSIMRGHEYSQSNGYVYPLYKTSGFFKGEGSNRIQKKVNCDEVQISGNNKGGENRRPPIDVTKLAMERRWRRMIKNRESAARSRARKTAYTCELEHELNAQRKENAMLKLMLAESENKRKLAVLKNQAFKEAHQREEEHKPITRTSSLGW